MIFFVLKFRSFIRKYKNGKLKIFKYKSEYIETKYFNNMQKTWFLNVRKMTF